MDNKENEKLNEYGVDLSSSEKVLQYLKDCYPNFYKIVMQEQFVPQTLDDVNNFLLYSYFDVKKDGKIECDISGTKKDEKENNPSKFVITKNNFYNAYCEKIWPNLTIKQQVQIIYWHFIFKCEENNVTDYSFRIVEDDSLAEGNGERGGYIGDYLKTLFLRFDNKDKGYESNYLSLIVSMEHEFEHVKQNNTNIYKLLQREKFNLFELNLILGRPALQEFLNLGDAYLNHAVYASNPFEISAEDKAIKQAIKYLKANEQVFGVLKKDRALFKSLMRYIDFDWHKLSKNAMQKSKKYSPYLKEIYLKNLKIYKDRKYFSKLIMLKIYLSDCLEYVEDEDRRQYISEKLDKVDEYLELYSKKQQKKKLNKDFFKALELESDELKN